MALGATNQADVFVNHVNHLVFMQSALLESIQLTADQASFDPAPTLPKSTPDGNGVSLCFIQDAFPTFKNILPSNSVDFAGVLCHHHIQHHIHHHIHNHHQHHHYHHHHPPRHHRHHHHHHHHQCE
eukprot:6310010-Amphidinium_carterae.2